MKKILALVDGSEISQKAAGEAVELAKKFDGEVTFLSVLEKKHPFYGGVRGGYLEIEANQESEQHQLHHYEELLATLVEKYQSPGLVLSAQTVTGDIDDEIEAFTKAGNFDLIVMGRRGLSPVKRFFAGSITRKVVDSAHCSVLVVKE